MQIPTSQKLLDGNSSFSLKIINEDGIVFVRKSSNNQEDSLRLCRQFLKQKNFRPFFNIDTSSIISTGYENNNFFFDMEFIRSTDCTSFFQVSSKKQIDFFIESIIEFIEFGLSKSVTTTFDEKIMFHKSEQVFMNAKKNVFYTDKELIMLYEKVVSMLDNTQFSCKLPLGPCHGDLTLSNILIKDVQKRICLIDFLDSFLETPLQDIVKIRQDTHFFWSKLFYNKAFEDQMRLQVVLEYIDKKINQHFVRYDFYKTYYTVFQVLNFFRLIPYTKSKRTKKFIMKNLHYLLEIP